MKKGVIAFGGMLIALLAVSGCAKKVSDGPVPTVTPRPKEDKALPTQAVTPEPTLPAGADGEVQRMNYRAQYLESGKVTPLQSIYKDRFTVGIEVKREDIKDEKKRELVKTHFNGISCREDLSPEYLIDYEKTKALGDNQRVVLDFTGADEILSFAKENNMVVRGYTLVPNNMPAWFFTKDFDKNQVQTVTEDGVEKEVVDYASPEVIKARMKNYMSDMINHINTNYPGTVVCWDVMNDIIDDSVKSKSRYRETHWLETLGEEYVADAFVLARELVAKDQKLFLQEDGMESLLAKPAILNLLKLLKEKNAIDGYAFHAAFTVAGPDSMSMNEMVKAISKLDLEVQFASFCANTITNSITDKDRTKEDNLAKCAKRYKALMSWFNKMDSEGTYDFTYISFEGLTDDSSSFNVPKEYVDEETGETVFGVPLYNYPYLFDSDGELKDAFFAAELDEEIQGF